MPDAKEDEILRRVGDVQTDVTAIKASAATSDDLKTKVTDLTKLIKEGPETSKNVFESLFEAFGFKDAFAAFKDGGDWVSKILLAIGAVAAVLLGKMVDFGKLLNSVLTSRGGGTGRGIAIGEDGVPRRLTADEMNAQNSVSINPHGLSEESINGLNSALAGITPVISGFNSATINMKSANKIKKIAKAIETLKGKLSPDPSTTIKDTATAIGALNTKLEHYDPNNLPKAQDLRNVQRAAHNLAETAETLRSKFVALSNGFNTAAQSL